MRFDDIQTGAFFRVNAPNWCVLFLKLHKTDLAYRYVPVISRGTAFPEGLFISEQTDRMPFEDYVPVELDFQYEQAQTRKTPELTPADNFVTFCGDLCLNYDFGYRDGSCRAINLVNGNSLSFTLRLDNWENKDCVVDEVLARMGAENCVQAKLEIEL